MYEILFEDIEVIADGKILIDEDGNESLILIVNNKEIDLDLATERRILSAIRIRIDEHIKQLRQDNAEHYF
jgi:hypothetical protein